MRRGRPTDAQVGPEQGPCPPQPVCGCDTRRAMRHAPNRDLVAGAILLIVGLFLLAGQLVPGFERFIPLLVGLALLLLFFVTRSPAALIPGGIVTGVGVGILVATQGDQQFGGAGFLMSLGGGFLLVSLLGAIFQVPEVRAWPLVPGSILIAVGALILAGQMGQTVLDIATRWWPLVLVIVGGYLVFAARGRHPEDVSTRSGIQTVLTGRDARRARERAEREEREERERAEREREERERTERERAERGRAEAERVDREERDRADQVGAERLGHAERADRDEGQRLERQSAEQDRC